MISLDRRFGQVSSTITHPAHAIATIIAPSHRHALPDHRAGQVHAASRPAPGRSARTFAITFRPAVQRPTPHQHMAVAADARRFADQADQRIARRTATSARAGVPALARLINFARGNAGEPNLRPFRAPDRAIAIPHRRRRAGKGLARRDERHGEERQQRDVRRPLPWRVRFDRAACGSGRHPSWRTPAPRRTM